MSSTDVSDSEKAALPHETQAGEIYLSGLTVTFEDVAVEVEGLGESYVSTVSSVVSGLLPSFKKDERIKRDILRRITGQVQPGEMLLVLGRPGSGCTSLLKVLANMRQEFASVSGKVCYGNIDHKEAQRFRRQIVMNTEDDQHFPSLMVSEVMEFAVGTKMAGQGLQSTTSKAEHVENKTSSILDSLGISHTMDTAVGDEFIRGVSGGERKRVSLAEVMATEASVQCWDNSTRGLDASNAFDFAKVLRRVTDDQRKTMIATLYQAGNGIYNQFDKVLVLAEGRQIYYGPTSEAKGYFGNLGFQCPPSGNVADFLTSVTVPTERVVLPGFESTAPKTTEEFEKAYKNSTTYSSIRKTMVDRLDKRRKVEKNRTFNFLSREHSVYQVSFAKQVWTCTTRQLQVMWGDRWTNSLKLISNIIVALISGSLFYHLAPTSADTFDRAGALYWPLLYLGLNCLSETTASFTGRPIFSRHKLFGFARPAAQAIACTLADIPFTILGVSIFEIIYYFLTGFARDGGKFFTQWFIYLVFTLCLLSFYRMIGAWNSHFGVASQIAGWSTMVIMVYAGYLIPVPSMHVWFCWLAYIDPVQYAFGALMGSETGGLILECVEPQFIPYGGNYEEIYRGCSAPGSTPGQSTYGGAEFLKAQYGDFTQHVWRNVGILNLQRAGDSKILFEMRAHLKSLSEREDKEKGIACETIGIQRNEAQVEDRRTDGTVFTFRDINYFVHAGGSEKQLLRNVSGFVTPGKLVALMGSSGAGKTTLMDVLAQRKDKGTVKGPILINGKPQGISFQRDTGYCEQNDVHEATATVREALLFSARLRQPHHVPDAEKVEYVEYVMHLLELLPLQHLPLQHLPLQHVVIGSPNSGLSIEQRKRLTIATELVAKPSLLFLDEPTSGLDGQSAYEICRFMKKLAAAGQTIICTIHQPSAVLFETFDVLLLLAKGGRTTYFGETGKDSSTVLDYFARHEVPCPPNSNAAEHIVDVVQGRFGTDTDWPAEWEASREQQQTMEKLTILEQHRVNELEGPSEEDEKDFAAPIPYQISQVTRRQLLSLWRNPDYVWNKIGLHVSNGLFAGFTFWKVGNGSFDAQIRLMSVFNFLFPLFIHNRDIFETREKKSKTYSWIAFISAQLLSEIFILIVCATVYFVSWYFTPGFPVRASSSGQVYLQMLLYEFLYTSIGQAIAAYSPNAYFAALANPLIAGTLIQFCGVFVPYSHINSFWRYWLYYLNPFNYLVGGLLVPVAWDTEVQCKASELTSVPLPPDTTCGEYMAEFLSQYSGYVTNDASTTICSYCPYSTGADYLRTLNFNERYYGWRDVGITALFCISFYALVFLMMCLRTKATKTAS
ncbi:putative ABC multidrug transporter [Xylaria digitata]|nr:putative ABC multidrug transporter [Xylaria digitata]